MCVILLILLKFFDWLVDEKIFFSTTTTRFVGNEFLHWKNSTEMDFGADGITKNEIDYIIKNRMFTVKNVTMLNNFTTGSDHWMVRAKFMLNTRFQISKLVKKVT